MKRQVSRKDIAQRAGTSVSVVSRALNNSGYVAKEKRELILRLAKEMNYNPRPSFDYMEERRTKKILFYCDDLNNPFYTHLYQGMREAASERGYMVLVGGTIAFEDIKYTLVDGIITSNQAIARYYMESAGKNYHLPVVSASYGDNITIQKALPIVEIDMFQVVEMALEYLYKQGHRHIAIGMPYEFDNGNSRTLAYLNWIKAKGETDGKKYYIGITKQTDMTVKEKRAIEEPEDFYGKGILAARVFMERKLDATAILGFNDEFSLGLLNGFKELGVKVPEDISVMGIDGISNRKYITPLLTTIDIHPKLQGAKCVEVLVDIIEGKKYKYVNRTKFQLLDGKSVRNIGSVRI